MKIISKGTKDIDKPREWMAECPTCGCRFQHTINEVQLYEPQHQYYIRCPQCSKIVLIPQNTVVEEEIDWVAVTALICFGVALLGACFL